MRPDIEKLRALRCPFARPPVSRGATNWEPAALLDSEEALAVAVGLRSAAVPSPKSLPRAQVKLEQVLPARIRRQVQALNTSVVSLRWGPPAIDADSLMVLAAACRNREVIKFQDKDAKGQPSTASRFGLFRCPLVFGRLGHEALGL